MKKILAISSGGGHWVQLLRLRPAFAACETIYATVSKNYALQVSGHRFYSITDATRWHRWRLFKMIFEVAFILLKERPNFIISTGAAPGACALRLGKFLGAKTIWIDSIANIEHMSMSGQKIKNSADLWLTQWEALAHQDGPHYLGSIL